ncbi:MAG: DNA-binding protein WhiA [Clostridia bacterium]|nr:DNA-binding protein WhiA [Clostridia bacterium]
MSFAGETKKELCKSILRLDKCCKFAVLYGILLFGNKFSVNEIKIVTEKDFIKETVYSLFKELFDIEPKIRGKQRHDNQITYTISVTEKEDIMKIENKYGFPGGASSIGINFMLLQNECCHKAFLKGAFITGGSVTNPEKRYHLEFATPHYYLFNDMKVFLMEKDIPVKNVIRKGHYIIYFKESESIEDMLTLMDATSSLFKMMDIKIVKDIRNHTNRITNCETANITKTVNASAKHVEAIEKIIDAYGSLAHLDDDIRQVAEKRLENPESTLNELGDMFTPPMSKSAINHRLKKILLIAEEL